MQRSSPALFDSPTFPPAKKRSLLRREAHVADDNDNDDTRQLLLAACRGGECQHHHHRYTTDSSSFINNNLTPAPQAKPVEQEHDNARQYSSVSPLAPHHQPFFPRYSSTAQSTPYTPPASSQVTTIQARGEAADYVARGIGPGNNVNKNTAGRGAGLRQAQTSSQPQRQTQSLQPKEHNPTVRQCSAPTPLYPVTPHVPVPIQQQRSFPEWSPRPRAGVLPLFQFDSTTSPPLSAAAASSSSPCYGDDLRHPAQASVLFGRGGTAGGDGERGPTAVQESNSWAVVRGPHISKTAALAAVASDRKNVVDVTPSHDDMDSQGRASRTPDSPAHSEDDNDDDDAMTGGGSELRDNLGNLVSCVPLHPIISQLHTTDNSPSEVDDDHTGMGGGGDGNSTSAGGISLSDDASILSLSDSNLGRSSPLSHPAPTQPPPPPPRLDLMQAHSPAAGSDVDFFRPSPEPDLSQSLSLYETADSRSRSSESAAVALGVHGLGSTHSEEGGATGSQEEGPPRPVPSPVGGATNSGQSPPADSPSPDRLLFPDASG